MTIGIVTIYRHSDTFRQHTLLSTALKRLIPAVQRCGGHRADKKIDYNASTFTRRDTSHARNSP